MLGRIRNLAGCAPLPSRVTVITEAWHVLRHYPLDQRSILKLVLFASNDRKSVLDFLLARYGSLSPTGS